MTSKTALLFTLDSSVKDIANSTLNLLGQTKCKSKVTVVAFEFFDKSMAQTAENLIKQFHASRIEYYSTGSSDSIALDLIQTDRGSLPAEVNNSGVNLSVPFTDYIPPEFFTLAQTIQETRLVVLPVTSSIVSLFAKFVETYDSISIIRTFITLDRRTTLSQDMIDASKDAKDIEQGTEGKRFGVMWNENFNLPKVDDLIDLHMKFLELGRLITQSATDLPPVVIIINGSSNNLTISANGQPIRLSWSKVKAIAALALLPYDQWFELNDFCKVAYPKNTYNPRGQFDAALKDLKKIPPFSWDAHGSKRRMLGVTIKSQVNKETLRQYLNQ